jgi:hypothetical protein
LKTVRYASVVVVWDDGALHPLETSLASCPEVALEATYQINTFGERVAGLNEFSGNLGRLETLLSDADSVFEYEISRETGLAYLEYRASSSMHRLFEILSTHPLVLVPPLEYTRQHGNRGVRVTLVGTAGALGALSTDIPQDIEMYPERVGEYEPQEPGVRTLLTDRQQTVFEVAVDRGYYEVPRETTHEQIANEVGKSVATVAEQLQRIESNLLPRYLGG